MNRTIKIDSKKIVIPLIALVLMMAGGVIWAGRNVSAADTTTTATSSTTTGTVATTDQSTFADKLSQKLGVDKDKVSSALGDIKKENQDARKQKVGANLDQAVKDGVITADQKQKILDHQSQMQAQRQKEKADNQQWAKDNGIDMSKLSPYLGHGKGGCKGKK